MIGARIPRGQRTSLLQIGSAIVTSRLLYGIGLISRGGLAAYQVLAPAYNRMIRFASGAYVTSPIPAVMAEAGMLPFDLLAVQATIRVAIRLVEKDRNNVDLPVVQRASRMLMEYTGAGLVDIEVRSRLGARSWYERKPQIVWDVKRKVRAGDPSEVVRPIVQEVIRNRFSQATVVYTDGSKTENAVGAGVFSDNIQLSIGLPSQCSVFSAEAYAIRVALNVSNSPNELLILSDSASCLSAIESGKSNHPWIQQIESAMRNRPVYLCWIPGHAGIRGNEEADRIAAEARSSAPVQAPIPGPDVVKSIKHTIRCVWDNRWDQCRDVKLREIKRNTSKWTDQDNSADQRVLTRLRIGHTRLTHSFLLKKEPPPVCDCCGTIVDVRHIILHCRKFDDVRQKNSIDATSLQAALCSENDNENKLLEFLRETNLYRKL